MFSQDACLLLFAFFIGRDAGKGFKAPCPLDHALCAGCLILLQAFKHVVSQDHGPLHGALYLCKLLFSLCLLGLSLLYSFPCLGYSLFSQQPGLFRLLFFAVGLFAPLLGEQKLCFFFFQLRLLQGERRKSLGEILVRGRLFQLLGKLLFILNAACQLFCLFQHGLLMRFLLLADLV